MRVLAVDDSPAVLRATSRILSRAGHDVVSVEDPEEALAALVGGGFDVVVSDVMMPGMTGLELRDRAAAAGVRAVFVFVTGGVPPGLEPSLAAERTVLTKPFDACDLRAAVEEAGRA